MSKNNFSAKEFAKVAKSARVEINGIFKSPFVVVNLLNKAAKGDFSKVANCDGLTRENVAKVAKVVKSLHAGRYAFDLSVFDKDYLGRFCTRTNYKGEISDLIADYMDVNGVSALVYTDSKGREIVASGEKYVILCPVPATINGVFAAFAKVAKVELSNNEKAEKAEKAAKNAAEKAEKAAKKGVISDYNAGRISEFELAAKLAEITEKYAA